ncbi:MAG: deoxynucleoside kinase [Candidatus Adlerbacteria bacterium]|nr:deoxynucleoside kinase [Candidatus Adlerbacteria bacterium]
MKRKGKLIVIDGSDGVGKATQTKLLVERLKKEKIPVETLDFPQYESNLFGKLIGECLAGLHGDFIGLDPKIASVLYAADRFESKQKIEKWLAAGKTVVLDRYVSANQMHQGGKIHEAKERKQFLQWLDRMEHEVFGLPRPDVILYLALPVEMALELLKEKHLASKKKYLTKGAKDQAENNVKHLLDSQQSALKLIQGSNNWKKIICSTKKGILSREDIHVKIWSIVEPLVAR